jgi:hypothetical protein
VLLLEGDQKIRAKVADEGLAVLQYFTMTSNRSIHVISGANLAYKRSH